jgi:hypothetical protein
MAVDISPETSCILNVLKIMDNDTYFLLEHNVGLVN